MIQAPKPPSCQILLGTVVESLTKIPVDRKFQLIYCDPPFYSGKHKESDHGAFSDRWPSLESYLEAMEESVAAMARRVAETGFFALHCDWHASHYLKVMGDRIFGYDNFRNELVWHYKGRRQPAIIRLNAKHDVILVWARSPLARMNALSEPVKKDEYVKMKHQPVQVDEDGREWIWGHMGRGRPHAYRIYLDEVVRRGKPLDDVWDMPIINQTANERVGYPTQKPVALLRRVLELLTNPGDLVGDFMAGSGTLGEAALQLNRSAILGDASQHAIDVMTKRLKDSRQIEFV
jgi:site-specific DNA-methyltransferase (adenine-specific)